MGAAMMAPAQVAALDQAIAAYRDACYAFARMIGEDYCVRWRAACAELRRAGYDAATGLVTLPVDAVTFTDVRADGARTAAVNRRSDDDVWVCWSGRMLRFGTEAVTYRAYDLIQVRA